MDLHCEIFPNPPIQRSTLSLFAVRVAKADNLDKEISMIIFAFVETYQSIRVASHGGLAILKSFVGQDVDVKGKYSLLSPCSSKPLCGGPELWNAVMSTKTFIFFKILSKFCIDPADSGFMKGSTREAG